MADPVEIGRNVLGIECYHERYGRGQLPRYPRGGMPASDQSSSAKPKVDPCAAVAAEFTHIPSVKHDPKGGPMRNTYT